MRPRIKLSSCLDAFTQSESINGFFSTACQAKVVANKYVAFVSLSNSSVLFPPTNGLTYLQDNAAGYLPRLPPDPPEEIHHSGGLDPQEAGRGRGGA